MSALDQAFIKAYAKDPELSAGPAVAVASPPARVTARQVGRSAAQRVEQLYHDGSLYRLEAPHAGSDRSAVPHPHVALLPPTSPRRAVRRSFLRFLANQAAAEPVESIPDQPPRVARKVIIRHIAHSAPPTQRGRLRATLTQSFDADLYAPGHNVAAQPTTELAPETIADEPPAGAPSPALPQPATVSPLTAPTTAPLNVSVDDLPQFAVHGFWQQGEIAPATVVVADSIGFPGADAAPLVTLSLDSLIAAEHALREHRAAERSVAEYEPAMTRFSGKALDDHDASQPVFRVDTEHPKAIHRPHARFAGSDEAERSASMEAAPPSSPATISQRPDTETVGDNSYIEAEAVEEVAYAAPPDSADTLAPTAWPELAFADAVTETAADDLTWLESESDADISPASGQVAPEAPARQAAPLWEIDHFQWPKTCQKLLDDENGYLQHAGNKLLAAVQDGLKVLAVTGSRRGEGRSTLALCLAKVAAQAGIQVALMDADFARPQLASKIALEIAFGWQDAALGKIPLSEAAVKSLADQITVLPLETSAAGRALSLADPRVTATVRAAAATFELLILDLGPIGPGEELAFPPGERCPLDAAIVVRDLRFATSAESEAIGHALQESGVEAVGIAENFVVEDEGAVHSFNA
jgi:Mrp family chromosome partitioning ATPase